MKLYHIVRYEDSDGESKRETFTTEDGTTTAVSVTEDGAVQAVENLGKEHDGIPEGPVPIFYVPEHRLTSIETEVLPE